MNEYDCTCDGGGSIEHMHDDDRCTGGHSTGCFPPEPSPDQVRRPKWMKSGLTEEQEQKIYKILGDTKSSDYAWVLQQIEDKILPDIKSEIALEIANSESLMWLMVGANHPEAHLAALRPAYQAYREAGGGYGQR